MTVVSTGSVAYDYIFTFKGRFGDQIVPDKTHIINLSFLVDTMAKRRGGVAANYAYTLALLGHRPPCSPRPARTAPSTRSGWRVWVSTAPVSACSPTSTRRPATQRPTPTTTT